MWKAGDRTYCTIIEYVKDLSEQINNMCNIQPEIFLRFSQDIKVTGSAILTYCAPNMYIELNIPHNYTLGKTRKVNLACILIHEYCHYIESLSMSGRERSDAIDMYKNNQKYKDAEEQRNWTATKRLAKKLELWNMLFYTTACTYRHTTSLRF